MERRLTKEIRSNQVFLEVSMIARKEKKRERRRGELALLIMDSLKFQERLVDGTLKQYMQYTLYYSQSDWLQMSRICRKSVRQQYMQKYLLHKWLLLKSLKVSRQSTVIGWLKLLAMKVLLHAEHVMGFSSLWLLECILNVLILSQPFCTNFMLIAFLFTLKGAIYFLY